MTILWIYDQPLIPEAGGTERITSLVAKGLTERGHKCLGILVFNKGVGSMTYDGNKVIDLYEFLKENKVDIVINQIAYAAWLLEAFLNNGGRRWHEDGGKIISCLHFDPCNPSVIQLLKSQDNWTFRHYINFIKFSIFKARYRNRQQKTEAEAYNFIYGNSNAFVALSETHFNYMHKVMNRKEYSKLYAIGNPLTFDIEVTPADLGNKENIILVCARMSEYHKRISIILKTWQRLLKQHTVDGWSLKIVGNGPDLGRYKSFALRKELSRIEFLGHQNPEPFYREAKILLLTSSAEGWGLTLTEAMQYGVVPVVMNSSSVYNEIITHLHDGFLTPNNNIGVFTKTIASLINDPHRLDAMQYNALESSKKFTLTKATNKWERLLNQL